MIVRRNTKAFKTIVDIVTACEGRSDRDKLIRLYITKAGHAIGDRISAEGIEEETDVFYDLTFAAVVANHFTHETILARLKDVGDPFAKLFKKSVNAGEQGEFVERHYGFLF